jgi:hypothetical protein
MRISCVVVNYMQRRYGTCCWQHPDVDIPHSFRNPDSKDPRASALTGRVDYVDLAERVVQGVTVEVIEASEHRRSREEPKRGNLKSYGD